MMRIKLRHAPIVVGSLFLSACPDDATPSVDTDASSTTEQEDTSSSASNPDPDSSSSSSPADTSTSTSPTSTTTTEDSGSSDSGTCVIPVQIIEDGSFEAGANSSPWGEASSAFGTPLCDMGTCGSGDAQDGGWFVWLGGANGGDIGGVSQEVTIPDVDDLELTFYFWFASLGNGGNVFQLQVDGDVLWEATDADAADYAGWTQVTVPMGDYADGGDHDIDFTGIAATGNGNLFLDNVVLEACAGGSVTESDTVDDVMTGAGTDTESTTDTDTGGDLVCEDVGSELPLAQDGDNTGAGDDYEPTCTLGDGGDGPEVSYTWTAPAAGTYRIDTLGSAVDTVVTVLDACEPDATEIACNDDFNSFQSAVIVSLAQDQTVAIIVDAWDAASAGPFTLNINQLSCEAPTGLGDGEPVEIDDDNLGAGDDTAASCGGVGGEDVIYSWTPPLTGLYAVYALSLEMSPVVSAYAGTCGDPTAEIGCGAGQNLSSFITAFQGGQEFTIVVDGADAAQVGTFELNIEAAGDIAGDCCAADDSSGCESVPVTQCVCGGPDILGFDASACCTGEWTAQCAGYAASQCDAGCELVDGGTCCAGDSGSPGCDAAPVEACVCEFDSFCCEGEWDDTCVATAVALCQAEC